MIEMILQQVFKISKLTSKIKKSTETGYSF